MYLYLSKERRCSPVLERNLEQILSLLFIHRSYWYDFCPLALCNSVIRAQNPKSLSLRFQKRWCEHLPRSKHAPHNSRSSFSLDLWFALVLVVFFTVVLWFGEVKQRLNSIGDCEFGNSELWFCDSAFHAFVFPVKALTYFTFLHCTDEPNTYFYLH